MGTDEGGSVGNRILPLFALIFSVVLWGISFVSIKIAVSEVPPFTLAMLRFSIASLFFLAILFIKEKKIKISGRSIIFLVLSGILGISLYASTENIGTQLTSASNASLLVSLTPAIVVVLDYFIYKNSLDIKGILGLIISIIGVYIIVSPRDINISVKYFWGNLSIIASTIFWAIFIMVNKYINSSFKISDLYLTSFQMTFGSIFLLPLSLIEKSNIGNISLNAWLNIIFLGVFCSGAAYFLYNYSVRKLGATITAVYLNLIPLIGVISGVLLLHEQLQLPQLIGGLIIIAGVTVIEVKKS